MGDSLYLVNGPEGDSSEAPFGRGDFLCPFLVEQSIGIMTRNLPIRELHTSEFLDETEFGIDPTQVAHIMGILRSSLYSRKALAVMREYSSNAWDAHRMSGKRDVPIEITLPTWGDPVFTCRDFGPGMSRKEVLKVYTLYGASTKRNITNPQDTPVGNLGIGAKSAFCINDSFTVTSWFDGIKSVYSAALDASNKGRMTLLHEEPCQPEETGIQIQVGIPSRFIPDFEKEAPFLFQFMNPQPKINLEIPPLPQGTTSGCLGHTNQWVGVMGCVPYRLDILQLQTPLQENGTWHTVQSFNGRLDLPIDSVDFAAHREELQYTERTIKTLAQYFRQLIDESIEASLKKIKSRRVSPWQKRIESGRILSLLRERKFELTRYAPNVRWDLRDQPFRFMQGRTAITQTWASSDTTLLLTDPKSRRGKWNLGMHDIEVVGPNGMPLAELREHLKAFLQANDCTGVAIGVLHKDRAKNLQTTRPRNTNPKYAKTCFTWRQTNNTKASDNWLIADQPEGEHVFVILASYKPLGFFSNEFARQAACLKQVLQVTGQPDPIIYGYKTTVRKALEAKDIPNGIPFKVYFDQTLKENWTLIKQASNLAEWVERFGFRYNNEDQTRWNRWVTQYCNVLARKLDPEHPLVVYLSEYQQCLDNKITLHHNLTQALSRLGLLDQKRPHDLLKDLHNNYPMLALACPNHQSLYKNLLTSSNTILDYIQECDSAKQRVNNP